VCLLRMIRHVVITVEERKAITSLERLAKKWPESLQLFSWSGGLCVLKKDETGFPCYIEAIEGIPNDGGDPEDNDVDQDPEIKYEEPHD